MRHGTLPIHLQLLLTLLPVCSTAQDPQPAHAEPRTSAGRTYFVDADAGSDRNSGSSAEEAFRSLRHAVGVLDREGGDTLNVQGTFRETLELLGINRRNHPAKPTVIRATNGASARIDGGIPPAIASFPFDQRGQRPGFGPQGGGFLGRGIVITDCGQITIEGLEVVGVAGQGILAWRSNGVTLRRCTVRYTGQSAITLQNGNGTDPVVRGMVVDHCTIAYSNLGRFLNRAKPGSFDMRSEALTIVRVEGFEVAHCWLHDCLMEGIDCKFGSSKGRIHHNLVERTRAAAYYVNEADDVEVDHNIAWGIGWFRPTEDDEPVSAFTWVKANLPPVSGFTDNGAVGFMVGNGDLSPHDDLETGRATKIRLHHNVAGVTRQNGFCVWNEWRREGRTDHALTDIEIVNNVAWNNCLGDNRAVGAIQIDLEVKRCTVRNNIIARCGQAAVRVWGLEKGDAAAFHASNTLARNLLFENRAPGHAGAGVLQGDPCFIDPSTDPGKVGDLRLGPNSAARAAAKKAGATADPVELDLGAFPDEPWVAGPHRGGK